MVEDSLEPVSSNLPPRVSYLQLVLGRYRTMKFSISFIALVSTVLFAAVHAAPAPLCNGEVCSHVAAREVVDVAFDGEYLDDIVQ
jgi:hypothetical protein